VDRQAVRRGDHYPVEILWCGNSGGNGWMFPAAVSRQLELDCEGKSVLHLFGGRASFGLRLDIDPETRPDVLGDAWLPPFGRETFDVVILDPPYASCCAEEKGALFRTAGWIARQRVVWFHTLWTSGSHGLKPERAWLVRVGDNRHVRALQYFQIASRPGPLSHFARGPAIKYNRWLRQPGGLALG
jgi:hypothetical protein